MTENTESLVLMKCQRCGYEEEISRSDLDILKDLPPFSKEDAMLCPFCLGNMHKTAGRQP